MEHRRTKNRTRYPTKTLDRRRFVRLISAWQRLLHDTAFGQNFLILKRVWSLPVQMPEMPTKIALHVPYEILTSFSHRPL